MATGTQGAGAHWSGFTGDALKVAELLVKLKFTEAVTNSIVGNGIDIGEEIEHLDDDMCNIFSPNFHNTGAIQYGVAVSMMAEVFLKILV